MITTIPMMKPTIVQWLRFILKKTFLCMCVMLFQVPGNDSDDDPGAPLPAEDWGEEGTVVGGSQFMAMLSDTQATSDGVFPPDSQEPLTGTNLVPMPKKVLGHATVKTLYYHAVLIGCSDSH